MTLAFIVATLAIISGGKVATVATVLGVYLIDAMYVILMRLWEGTNPLHGDYRHHLHFRLRSIGMRDIEIRTLVFTLSAAFGVAVIFLDRIGKIILFLILAVLVVSMTRIVRAWKQRSKEE